MVAICDNCDKKKNVSDVYAKFKKDDKKKFMCPECYRQFINEKYADLESFVVEGFNKNKSTDSIYCEIRKKYPGEFTDNNAFVYSIGVKNHMKNEWKQTVNEFQQTNEGRQELSKLGSVFIRRGVIWTIIGVTLTSIGCYLAFYHNFPFVLIFCGAIVYGIYCILKGFYYKGKYRQKKHVKL